MTSTRTIWSLGTSNRSLDEFVGALRHHAIRTVVDVRHFPRSRFQHFCAEELASALARHDVAYVWLGEQLGGYRKGGYEAYMETMAFQRGLERLEALAERSRTAFVCAERLPWRCHRRLIGDALARSGWDVRHIIEAGRIWRPKEQLHIEPE
ncbi:MAG: DUF488 family protein [Armatimonadota bacterium]